MTPGGIQAHLNGGPRDDTYIVVERDEFVVARQERFTLSTANANDPVLFRTGRYRMRLDSNGDRVPHDLAGTVEFDFQGWDR
jgi:hypothetical protein